MREFFNKLSGIVILLVVHGAVADAGDNRVITSELLKPVLSKLWVENGTSYKAIRADLNADSVDELIVWLTGPDWCGSGGCTLLILEKGFDGFKLQSKIPSVRLPVAVSTAKNGDWKSLIVTSSGGGAITPKRILIRYVNGHYQKTDSQIKDQGKNILIDDGHYQAYNIR